MRRSSWQRSTDGPTGSSSSWGRSADTDPFVLHLYVRASLRKSAHEPRAPSGYIIHKCRKGVPCAD